jgi:hypothetical protein
MPPHPVVTHVAWGRRNLTIDAEFHCRADRNEKVKIRMSRPIVVNIPHSLGKDEAIRRMKSGFVSVSSNLPILKVEEQTWTDDRLTFRIAALGQSASGTADVGDTNVHIEIILPWLMQSVAELVQSAIKSRTQVLLEKK